MKRWLSVLFFILVGFIGLSVFSVILALFGWSRGRVVPGVEVGPGGEILAGSVSPYAPTSGLFSPEFVLTIIVILAVLIIVVGVLALVALRILRGPALTDKGAPTLDVEQTRIVQEIYQGLTQMERRIESLETLLLDRSRNAESLYKD